MAVRLALLATLIFVLARSCSIVFGSARGQFAGFRASWSGHAALTIVPALLGLLMAADHHNSAARCSGAVDES